MEIKKLFLCGLLCATAPAMFASEQSGSSSTSAVVEKTVKIQTNDGKEFNVPLSIAKKIITIKNMLGDLGENSDDPIPLPNVDGPTFELLISWIEFVGFATAHSDEDRTRAYEALKTKLLEQCEAENIQVQLNLLASLGMSANFLDPHLFDGEDTYSVVTMNIIAQLLVDLLTQNKEALFSDTLKMPTPLNAFHTDSVFVGSVMNILQNKDSAWACQVLNHQSLVSCVALHPRNKILSLCLNRGLHVWGCNEKGQFALQQKFGESNTSFIMARMLVNRNGEVFVPEG